MKRRLGRLWLAISLGFCVIGTFGCQYLGGEEKAAPSSPESRAAAGGEIFLRYCASCHGPEARGDGPASAALKKPPADLTLIAARRGGVFPASEVARYIDGRERVRAHGPADMPIWGRIFDDREEGFFRDETLLAPGQIYLIVEYLRGLQRSE